MGKQNKKSIKQQRAYRAKQRSLHIQEKRQNAKKLQSQLELTPSKRVFKPFIMSNIPTIESWLAEEAARGFELVDYKRWMFYFVEKDPSVKEYFLVFDPEYKKLDYSIITTRFFEAPNRTCDRSYDYIDSKSVLNAKNKTRRGKFSLGSASVCEIDISKKDEFYDAIKLIRAKHYMRFYRGMLALFGGGFAVSLVCLIIGIIEGFTSLPFLIMTIFLSICSLYSLVNFMALLKQKKKLSYAEESLHNPKFQHIRYLKPWMLK